MKKAGLEIDGIVVSGFAMKNLVLQEDEIKNGVVKDASGNGNDAIVSGNCEAFKGSVYLKRSSPSVLTPHTSPACP